MYDVQQGWTTLQTDNKLCAARSPPQGHPHRGLRGRRTTGQKESKTYRKYRHGDDCDGGADGNDGADGDGDGAGKGVDVDVMGGQLTNLRVAICT